MKTISEIRLENARALQRLVGGQSAMVEKTGRSQSQISQLMGERAFKPIGNKIARSLEQVFEKPEGWLDQDHSAGFTQEKIEWAEENTHNQSHERRSLTPAELEWARNLKREWLSKKNASKFTQSDAAHEFGWTQGAVGQYINGKIPLNTDAKLKFARFLDIPVSAIDPDFEEFKGPAPYPPRTNSEVICVAEPGFEYQNYLADQDEDDIALLQSLSDEETIQLIEMSLPELSNETVRKLIRLLSSRL